MTDADARLRTMITKRAAEWYAANRGELPPEEAQRFAAWLKTSPVHVQEYLAVISVDRDLRQACGDSDETLEAYLARRRAADHGVVRQMHLRRVRLPWGTRTDLPVWKLAGAAVAGIGALCLIALLWKFGMGSADQQAAATVVHLQTGHGEQLSQRLADGSVVQLDTDTSVTVRYDKLIRQITLNAGQANFAVAHEQRRNFRVFAGPAEVIAVGTNFDVRIDPPVAVVTVVEGRVAVGLATATTTPDSSSRTDRRFVSVVADQQIEVAAQKLPEAASAADAERATSWMHRQLAFENERLERVVAELNRYSATPIEVVTPSLRRLRVSGVFATDDSQSFLDFLRSLEGVRVEVTPTVIRVSKK